MLYRKLRGVIKEKDYHQEDIGDLLGFCAVSVSMRLTGKCEWKLCEAYAVLKFLDIPIEEFITYFPPGGRALPEKPKPDERKRKLAEVRALLRDLEVAEAL